MLEADRRDLSRSGEPLTMQSRACDLLLFLVLNRNRAIDSDALPDVLCPGSIVTKTVLLRCVMTARRVVGDDAHARAIAAADRHSGRARDSIEGYRSAESADRNREDTLGAANAQAGRRIMAGATPRNSSITVRPLQASARTARSSEIRPSVQWSLACAS